MFKTDKRLFWNVSKRFVETLLFSQWRRWIAGVLSVTFGLSVLFETGHGSVAEASLNEGHLKSSYLEVSHREELPLLRAIRIDPDSPWRLHFLLDMGHQKHISPKESEFLVRLFMAALTIPEKDIWVNLSPFEKDRVIPEQLEATDLGRTLLEQDYLLKRLSSSLTYPESVLGEEYWDQVFAELPTENRSDTSINMFNKVWVVPEQALVYENDFGAVISDSVMNVMLETDYLAQCQMKGDTTPDHNHQTIIRQLTDRVARRLILPEIKAQINHGRHFARLRQVYHALILALWFKRTLKRHVLNQVLSNQSKVAGIDHGQDTVKDDIYNAYVHAFHEGAYHFVKEEYNSDQQTVTPRIYYSGGFFAGVSEKWLSLRPLNTLLKASPKLKPNIGSQHQLTADLIPIENLFKSPKDAELRRQARKKSNTVSLPQGFQRLDQDVWLNQPNPLAAVNGVFFKSDTNLITLQTTQASNDYENGLIKTSENKNYKKLKIKSLSKRTKSLARSQGFRKRFGFMNWLLPFLLIASAVAQPWMTVFQGVMQSLPMMESVQQHDNQQTPLLRSMITDEYNYELFHYHHHVVEIGDNLTEVDQVALEMIANLLTRSDVEHPSVMVFLEKHQINDTDFIKKISNPTGLKTLLTNPIFNMEQSALVLAFQLKAVIRADGLIQTGSAGTAAVRYHDEIRRNWSRFDWAQTIGIESVGDYVEDLEAIIDIRKTSLFNSNVDENHYIFDKQKLGDADREALLLMATQIQPQDFKSNPVEVFMMNHPDININEFRNKKLVRERMLKAKVYSPWLQSLVLAFQAKYDIQVDGVPGPQTWRVLNDQLHKQTNTQVQKTHTNKRQPAVKYPERILDKSLLKRRMSLTDILDAKQDQQKFLNVIGSYLTYQDIQNHQSLFKDEPFNLIALKDARLIESLLHYNYDLDELSAIQKILIEMASQKAKFDPQGKKTKREVIIKSYQDHFNLYKRVKLRIRWLLNKANHYENWIWNLSGFVLLMHLFEMFLQRRKQGDHHKQRLLDFLNNVFHAKKMNQITTSDESLFHKNFVFNNISVAELRVSTDQDLIPNDYTDTEKKKAHDRIKSLGLNKNDSNKLNLILRSNANVAYHHQRDLKPIVDTINNLIENNHLLLKAFDDQDNPIDVHVLKVVLIDKNEIYIRLYTEKHDQNHPIKRLLIRHDDLRKGHIKKSEVSLPVHADRLQYLINRWNNIIKRDLNEDGSPRILPLRKVLADLYYYWSDKSYKSSRFRPDGAEFRRIRDLANETLSLSGINDDIRQTLTAMSLAGDYADRLYSEISGIDQLNKFMTEVDDFLNVNITLHKNTVRLSIARIVRIIFLIEWLLNRYIKQTNKSIVDFFIYYRHAYHSLQKLSDGYFQNVKIKEFPLTPEAVKNDLEIYRSEKMKERQNTTIGNEKARRHGLVSKSLLSFGALFVFFIQHHFMTFISFFIKVLPIIAAITVSILSRHMMPNWIAWKFDRRIKETLKKQKSFRVNRIDRNFDHTSDKYQALLWFKRQLLDPIANHKKTFFHRFFLSPKSFISATATAGRDEQTLRLRLNTDVSFIHMADQINSDRKIVGFDLKNKLKILKLENLNFLIKSNNMIKPFDKNSIKIEFNAHGIDFLFQNQIPMDGDVILVEAKDKKWKLEVPVAITKAHQLILQYQALNRMILNSNTSKASDVKVMLENVAENTNRFIKHPIDFGDFKRSAKMTYELIDAILDVSEKLNQLSENFSQDPNKDFILDVADMLRESRDGLASVGTLYTRKGMFFSRNNFLNSKFMAPFVRITRRLMGISLSVNRNTRQAVTVINQVGSRWYQIRTKASELYQTQKPKVEDTKKYIDAMMDSYDVKELEYLFPANKSLGEAEIFGRNMKAISYLFSLSWLLLTHSHVVLLLFVAGFQIMVSLLALEGFLVTVPFLSALFALPIQWSDFSLLIYFMIVWSRTDTDWLFYAKTESKKWEVRITRARDSYKDSGFFVDFKNKIEDFWYQSNNILYVLGIFYPATIIFAFMVQRSIWIFERSTKFMKRIVNPEQTKDKNTYQMHRVLERLKDSQTKGGIDFGDLSDHMLQVHPASESKNEANIWPDVNLDAISAVGIDRVTITPVPATPLPQYIYSFLFDYSFQTSTQKTLVSQR